MSTLDSGYVTGLLEGVGSFTFSRGRGQLTLVFAMRMAASNRRLLERVQRFFRGAGRIYDTSASTALKPRAQRRSCLFRVTRPGELLRLIEHLDRHPLVGDKRRVYGIWREMVMLRAAHTGSRPTADLLSCAERLATARRGATG